jgi:hypothetical protein
MARFKRALGFYTCAPSTAQGGSAANTANHIRKIGALKVLQFFDVTGPLRWGNIPIYFIGYWLFNWALASCVW